MQNSKNQSQKALNRRASREIALQILYQTEFHSNPDVDLVLQSFHREAPVDSETSQYARFLVVGVREKFSEIDTLIQDHSKNWKLDRMPHVDRNILRIAIFEMLQKNQDIPKTVSINEAIEIAKKFGTQESSAFINGLLDRISSLI